MATLMDTLKSKLNAETPKAELGQTERVSKLAQGKTGRADSGDTGPSRSVIQEKSAAQTANLGMDQQSLANRLQSQQLTQQEATQDNKVEEARLNLSDRLQSYTTAFETQSEDILREFERDTRSLEDSRDAAKTEQLGFLLRLQDQQYLSKLKSEGQLERFNSEQAFREAATRSSLQDLGVLLENDLSMKTIANATKREFNEQLFEMDIAFADTIASSLAEAQKQERIFTNVGNIAQAGAQYYGNKKSSNSSSSTSGEQN